MRYVTFGQNHVHSIDGKTFDKDCVAVIEGDREDIFKIFGDKWCFEYSEKQWEDKDKKCFLRLYPRGLIKLGE